MAMNARERLEDVKFFTAQLRNYDDAVRRMYKVYEDQPWTTMEKSRADEIFHGLERWRNVMVAAVSKLESNTTIESVYSTIQQESTILLTLINRHRQNYSILDVELAIFDIVTAVRNGEIEIEEEEEEEEEEEKEEEEEEEEEREEQEITIFDYPQDRIAMWQSFLSYIKSANIELTRRWLQNPHTQNTFGFPGIGDFSDTNITIGKLIGMIEVDPTSIKSATPYWSLVRSALSAPEAISAGNMRRIRKILDHYTTRILFTNIGKDSITRNDSLRMLELLYLGGDVAKGATGLRELFNQTVSDVFSWFQGFLVPPSIINQANMHAVRYYLLLLIRIHYRRKQPNLDALRGVFQLVQKIMSPDSWLITADSTPFLDLAWLPSRPYPASMSSISKTKVNRVDKFIRSSWSRVTPMNGLKDTFFRLFIDEPFDAPTTIRFDDDIKQNIASTVGDYLSKFWFDGLTLHGGRSVDTYIEELALWMKAPTWFRFNTQWPTLTGVKKVKMEDLLVNTKLVHQYGIVDKNAMARLLLYVLTAGMWESWDGNRRIYELLPAARPDKKINDVLLDINDTSDIDLKNVFGDAAKDIGEFSVVHGLFVWWTLTRRINLLNAAYLQDINKRHPLESIENYIQRLTLLAKKQYEADFGTQQMPWSPEQEEQLWKLAQSFLQSELTTTAVPEVTTFQEDQLRARLIQALPNTTAEEVDISHFINTLNHLKRLFRGSPAPVIQIWLDDAEPIEDDQDNLMPFFNDYAALQIKIIDKKLAELQGLSGKIKQNLEGAVLLVKGLVEDQAFPKAYSETVVRQFIKGVLSELQETGKFKPVELEGPGGRSVQRLFTVADSVFKFWNLDVYRAPL